jgi:hypothetical protein
LMRRLAQLPPDTIFFTQITMEAAEDPEFLDAMQRAHIKGALVGVESVTPEGLKDVRRIRPIKLGPKRLRDQPLASKAMSAPLCWPADATPADPRVLNGFTGISCRSRGWNEFPPR